MGNIYEVITQTILDRIKEAEKDGKPFFWVRPWTGGIKYPASYTTGKPYQGINAVLLEAGEYITYKALMEYKGSLSKEDGEKIQIKKGCHKVPVYFFGSADRIDRYGIPVSKVVNGCHVQDKYFFMKYYSAFHIEDIEGLPSHYPAEHFKHTPSENEMKLEYFIKAYARGEGLSIDIVKDGAYCFYSQSEHKIRVPAQSGFKTAYGYYASILHELVHSTVKGLKREASGKFTRALYSREELVAEIGSQILLSHFGIIPEGDAEIDNDIAYIRGWAEHLNDNQTEIVRASCQAQKSVEYFMEVAERQLKIEAAAQKRDDSKGCDSNLER